MAVKPFSKEQLNFFKFSTLVLDEFPKVLRQIFITMWDSKIAIRPRFIPWDDSTKVRNMLHTSEGGKTDIPTTKSIEEWDCTALFKATIYAKTFGVPGSKGSNLSDLYLKKVKAAPGSFHSSVQSSTGNQDETYALAIDQLRLLRNILCHSPKPEIVKTDFDQYVQLVTNALTAVNVDTAFVDIIGQMSEDDFPTKKVQELHECHFKELQANSMFHENIEHKLSSIEERTEKIENVGQNVEQKLSSIEERTGKIGNVEQKLSSIEERTEKIQNVEQNMVQKLSSIEEQAEKIGNVKQNMEQKLSSIDDKMHTMMKSINMEEKGNIAGNLNILFTVLCMQCIVSANISFCSFPHIVFMVMIHLCL